MNYYGTTTMTECTIMENDTPTFSRSSGSIILKECSVSSDQLTSTTWLDISSIGTKSFINELTFITTGDCVNLFDTIGSLIPSTKSSSLVTKPFYLSVFQKKNKPYPNML